MFKTAVLAALTLCASAAPTGALTYHDHVWPDIRDTNCVITHAWEDGSARAHCTDHDWVYDADGNDPPASIGYHGPRWEPGWYMQSDMRHKRHRQMKGGAS